MTPRLAVLAVLAVAALAVGCGEKEEPQRGGRPGPLQKFTLLLDWVPNPDHAGIYTAVEEGYYEQAGIDLEIRTPGDSADPVKFVTAGRADIAVSYPTELLLARDRRPDLVSVGALVQKPLTSLMSLNDRVREVRDLRGKRVGTAGIAYQTAYLETILRRAGIDSDDVDQIDVGFNLVQSMVGRRVDATLGAFWNIEGVELEAQRRRPTILRVEQLGVPTYPELIFIVRREQLDQRGASLVRRFLLATARGHQRLQQSPETGIEALRKADRKLDRESTARQLRATLPVFFPSDDDKPFGWQERTQWDAYGRWMFDNRLVKRQPNAAQAMTNEFLPGEALDPGPAGLD